MSDLRGQLETIYLQHGTLTPTLVVDEARHPEHPLHNRFEWEDEVAGEAWRRHQAHELIQSVRVAYKTEGGKPKSVRAYHAVRSDEGYTYEPVEKVVADPFMSKLVLQTMEHEWKTLRSRYKDFEEFWTMVRGDVREAS